jgi:RNA polymerase sigma-70 factor, ECF subfamily
MPPPSSLEVSAASLPAQTAREEVLDVRACLEKVRQRDEDAARALLQHLYPLVIKLVRAHLPRRTSEEDLAQTIFMKMFANLDQYSGLVPLEHWVSRIAINVCLNQLRVEKVRPELRWADLGEEEAYLLECLAVTSDEVHPDQDLASKELVHKLLERLSPPDRLIIQLLHMEGRSVKEISSMTGWSGALVKVRAFRARHKLRQHLTKLMTLEQP